MLTPSRASARLPMGVAASPPGSGESPSTTGSPRVRAGGEAVAEFVVPVGVPLSQASRTRIWSVERVQGW